MKIDSESFSVESTDYGKYHDIKHLPQYSKQRMLLTTKELEELSNSLVVYLQSISPTYEDYIKEKEQV